LENKGEGCNGGSTHSGRRRVQKKQILRRVHTSEGTGGAPLPLLNQEIDGQGRHFWSSLCKGRIQDPKGEGVTKRPQISRYSQLQNGGAGSVCRGQRACGSVGGGGSVKLIFPKNREGDVYKIRTIVRCATVTRQFRKTGKSPARDPGRKKGPRQGSGGSAWPTLGRKKGTQSQFHLNKVVIKERSQTPQKKQNNQKPKGCSDTGTGGIILSGK